MIKTNKTNYVMNNKTRRAELTNLIEMVEPSWLTKSVYTDYLEHFNFYREKAKKQFPTLVGQLCKIDSYSLRTNPQWGFIDVPVNAKFFIDLWKNDGKLISPPSTGQDPKSYSDANYRTAQKHFAHMWGDENGSKWINAGVLNLCLYPNKEIVLEATDIEHRLWGIIGGGLDWVALPSGGRNIYFESPNIERDVDGSTVSTIQINGLTISGIVEKANQYCKEGKLITRKEVLDRYYEGIFTLRLLPMYNETECHEFYGDLNESSAKSESQLSHAFTYPSNLWIKQFSSIKLSRFKPGSFSLHPVYSECYNNKKLIKLESFMNAHCITQYILNANYFVSASPSAIKKEIENTNGYGGELNDEIKDKIFKSMDILYKFFKSCKDPYITHHITQQILHSINYLERHDKVIADWNLFSNKLMDFINQERVHQYDDPAGKFAKGDKTKLGRNLGAQGITDAYKPAFKYIRNNFLTKCIDENGLEYGVSDYSERIPRLFSKKIIMDSYKDENDLDVDGKLFDKPVGGHSISDFELIRMTDDERIQAFIDEGLGDTFDFNSNCRAMSAYHNNRMGILRLSEYRTVMHLDNDAIKRAIKAKYETYKGKPILV